VDAGVPDDGPVRRVLGDAFLYARGMSTSGDDDRPSSETGTPSERRADVRHLACFPAHVEVREGDARTALIRDLSVTGARLLTRAVVDVGQRVKLSLHLKEYPPGESPQRVVQGVVVRDERREPEVSYPWPYTVAVKFDTPVPDLEAEVRTLAERQAELFGQRTRK
jgi:hypothetical protein